MWPHEQGLNNKTDFYENIGICNNIKFSTILYIYDIPMEIVMIFLFQNDIFRTSKEYFWFSYTKSSNQNSGTDIEILFTSSIMEEVNLANLNLNQG